MPKYHLAAGHFQIVVHIRILARHTPRYSHENGKLQRQQTELQCLLQTNRKLWTDLHFICFTKQKQTKRNAAKKPLGYKAQAPQDIKKIFIKTHFNSCMYLHISKSAPTGSTQHCIQMLFTTSCRKAQKIHYTQQQPQGFSTRRN